jgi:hypothetical protein
VEREEVLMRSGNNNDAAATGSRGTSEDVLNRGNAQRKLPF